MKVLVKLIQKIHSPKKGPILFFIRSLLWFVSIFYRMVTAMRNSGYDVCNSLGRGVRWKFFKVSVYSFKPKVISIGNIVAGGTGKTPLTILLAQEILQRKKRLAILSRGYKAKMESDTLGPQKISQGQGPLFLPHECGDEPYLISSNVPEALFYVGKNRVESARMANDDQAQVILLDDGMQYRKLHRNFEVVILDQNDPFGQNYFLPRGLLREHPKSLKRADLIVINHAKDAKKYNKLREKIATYSGAPIVGTACVHQKTISLNDNNPVELNKQKVVAFCAIAKPNYFFEMIEAQGAIITSRHVLLDHQKPTANFLDSLQKQALRAQAQWIVCTEKDAVKIQGLKTDIPIAYAKMKLDVIYHQEEFEKALDAMA